MTEPCYCPRCRATITADSPAGLCLNRIVAVKLMAPGLLLSEAEASRFQTEAEVIANLRHPNIVAVHDVGVFDGQRYFSMDYVEGQSLAAVVKSVRFQGGTRQQMLSATACPPWNLTLSIVI